MFYSNNVAKIDRRKINPLTYIIKNHKTVLLHWERAKFRYKNNKARQNNIKYNKKLVGTLSYIKNQQKASAEATPT